MKFFHSPILLSLLFLWSTNLFAQEPTTYSLEIHSIISEHGNTLGPVVGQSINDQRPDWQKVNSGEGDYRIHVRFLEGLDTKQYHREKMNRRQYIYQVKYLTPSYDAIIMDRDGNTILQKNYGGDVVINPFGEEDQYASPDTLAKSWKIHRDAFYELEEARYNNVNALLEEFYAIIDQGAAPIVEVTKTKIDKDKNMNVVAANSTKNRATSENISSPQELKQQKEEVVLAIAEDKTKSNTATSKQTPNIPITNNSNPPAKNTTAIKNQTIKEKADKVITPQVPNRNLDASDETVSTNNNQIVETPTAYANNNSTSNETETETETLVQNNNTPSKEETFSDSKTEPSSIDPETGLVAGETKPVPTPQKRKVESPEESSKPKETDAQRKARLERIQAEWDEMDRADEEKNKRPRVRHVRIGARTLFPILAGGYGEVVLPVLDNRISLVGDFSRINFAGIIKPFLEGESGLDGIDVIYRYYSVGANYYFRKKYARGWYLGASYLNNIVKTEVQATGDNSLKGEVGVDAAALRFGVTTGRNAFFFGFEVGAGVPLGKLNGTFYSETDGELDLEVINENIGIVPVLNITLGVAL